MIKTIPKKKKCKKGKMVVRAGLTNNRKEEKLKARRIGKIYPFDRRVHSFNVIH